MAGGGYDQIFSDFILATGENSKVMGQAINSANNTVDASLADSLKYLDNSYKEAQAYLTPFRVAGENSIQTLNNFIGVNGKAAQQQALSTIMQPAMNAMVDYGPQVAQQAMSMFFGAAGVPMQQSNQLINQATATAIQSHPSMIGDTVSSLQAQLEKLNANPQSTYDAQRQRYIDGIQSIKDRQLAYEESTKKNQERALNIFGNEPVAQTPRDMRNPSPVKKLNNYEQILASDAATKANLQKGWDEQLKAYQSNLDNLDMNLKTKYNGDINAAMKAEPNVYDPTYASKQLQLQIDGVNQGAVSSSGVGGPTPSINNNMSMSGSSNPQVDQFSQYLNQYKTLMNSDPSQFSNQLLSSTLSGPGMGQYNNLRNTSPEAFSSSLSNSALSGPGMGQYNDLRNTSAADFSNNLMGSLLDPVTGQVTKATQGFTDSMMKYGIRGIDQSAASKGMLNSGRTIQQAQDFGMGVAGQYIIPALQNVLGMGMQAGTNQANQIMQAGTNQYNTNVNAGLNQANQIMQAGNAQLATGVNAGMNQAGNIMQSGTNLLGQQTSILNQQNQSQTSLANQYMGSMLGGGAQLGSQSIGSTQSALSNLLAQATGASTTGAGLAGQQGTTGSGYNMQVGQYKADNALLNGKVQMDALNTMSQLQFLQDMGPYVNQLGAIPGISAGGGGGGSSAAAQHNAVDSQAQNYLRSGGGGGNGLYKGPGYNTGAGQNFGWVNPGPQGQTVGGGWGATYTPG